MHEILELLQSILDGSVPHLGRLIEILIALILYVWFSEYIKDAKDRIFRGKRLKKQIELLHSALFEANLREDDAKSQYAKMRDLAEQNILDKNALLWENTELKRTIASLQKASDGTASMDPKVH